MGSRFEFRLRGVSAPAGQLRVDDLSALIGSIKEIASRIGRAETSTELTGRAPKRVHRVSDLTIGLASGSTRLLIHRSAVDETLEVEAADERAFDERFTEVVDGLATNARPIWMNNALAHATDGLGQALRRAATGVEFVVDGVSRQDFRTIDIERVIWLPEQSLSHGRLTFVGRLYSANLDSHHLQVRDDAGNRVALPDVEQTAGIGLLLDHYVVAVGQPVRDSAGRLTKILDARISEAPDPLGRSNAPAVVPTAEILASSPGPQPGGIDGLTDEEFDAFFDAMGL